jgi:hypothetical protein
VSSNPPAPASQCGLSYSISGCASTADIQRGLGDLFTGISAVGEDALDEREDAPRSPQKRSAAVAILDARRMRFEHEATPVGVDERVALAPVDRCYQALDYPYDDEQCGVRISCRIDIRLDACRGS